MNTTRRGFLASVAAVLGYGAATKKEHPSREAVPESTERRPPTFFAPCSGPGPPQYVTHCPNCRQLIESVSGGTETIEVGGPNGMIFYEPVEMWAQCQPCGCAATRIIPPKRFGKTVSVDDFVIRWSGPTNRGTK